MIEHFLFGFDANLSEISVAITSLNKINTKLHLLYRKHDSLYPELWRLLCKSLIQTH